MELKLVQTGYAGRVDNLYARHTSLQFSMGRDKIVLLYHALLSDVEE